MRLGRLTDLSDVPGEMILAKIRNGKSVAIDPSPDAQRRIGVGTERLLRQAAYRRGVEEVIHDADLVSINVDETEGGTAQAGAVTDDAEAITFDGIVRFVFSSHFDLRGPP